MYLPKSTILLAILGLTALPLQAQITPVSQMERLNRGVVALPGSGGKGNFVSWRLLGTDDNAVVFDLLRDGQPIATDLTVTNFTDTEGTTASGYQVVAKLHGDAYDTSATITPWNKIYTTLTLDRPAEQTMPDGTSCTYVPSDCSTGDADGDGEYDIVVKWDPSNAKDNSQDGYTGNVLLDCYRLNGERLWRIDLGPNIRAGAHYTQFMFYDFDGDGCAELMCKTAPGSIDGTGQYVNQAATDDAIRAADNSKDHRSGSGRIVGGQEYLTVFSGPTGKAIHTVFYRPNRDTGYGGEATGTFNWDDRSGKKDYASYGNRGERHLACVAYLAGADQRPSGVFSRGYYTFAFIWAVDFDGTTLTQRWFHESRSKTQYSVTDAQGTKNTYTAPQSPAGYGRNTMYGNGNHNLSVADVDGDGKDEVIWGSAALDDDGRLLYSVGFGHGDAIHLGDLNPDRPGLELFDIHEDKGTYAWDMHDAATGEILFKGGQSGQDNGRGIAADIVASSRGYEFWSAYGGFDSNVRNQNPFNAITGEEVGQKKPSMNFRIYWNGDKEDELLDGTTISRWNNGNTTTVLSMGNYNASQSCNGTKSTPCLQADILGDWREEVILWSKNDNCTLNIFTTNYPTDYRVPCLMHDHTYRMGVAWQNTAYNQPPHLGYYLPDYLDGSLTAITQSSTHNGKQPTSCFNLSGQRVASSTHGVCIKNNKKVVQ